MRGKAVLQLALLTGPAFTTHRTPVQDHFIANGYVGDSFSDFSDYTGGFVTKQVRVVISDATFDIQVIGVADTAGRNIDNDLTGARIWHHNRFNRYRSILGPHNCGLNLIRHSSP